MFSFFSYAQPFCVKTYLTINFSLSFCLLQHMMHMHLISLLFAQLHFLNSTVSLFQFSLLFLLVFFSSFHQNLVIFSTPCLQPLFCPEPTPSHPRHLLCSDHISQFFYIYYLQPFPFFHKPVPAEDPLRTQLGPGQPSPGKSVPLASLPETLSPSSQLMEPPLIAQLSLDTDRYSLFPIAFPFPNLGACSS